MRWLLIAGLTLAACGSPEVGLDPNRNLMELNQDETRQVCQFIHDIAPPDGEYNCVGGSRVIKRDMQACVQRNYWGGGWEECTVGALEACYAVINEAGTWCGLDLLGPCERANSCNFSRP